MSDTPIDTSNRWTPRCVMLTIVAFVAAVWFLKVSYFVTAPVVLALFLTGLVHPILDVIVHHVPGWAGRFLGVLASLLTVVLISVAFLGLLVLGGMMVSSAGAEYGTEIEEAWVKVETFARENGIAIDKSLTESDSVKSGLMGAATMIVNIVYASLFLLIVALFLALLFLTELPRWHNKVGVALPDGRSNSLTHTASTISRQMRRYILNRTIVSLISGTSYGLILWALGIRYALLFALIAFLLNYIPMLGSIVSLIPPTVMALVQFGWVWALVALGLLMFVESINSYYIDPRIEGKSLRISPAVALVAILFWGWLWGIAGAALAVPIAVATIALLRHNVMFRPVAELLSNDADRCPVNRSGPHKHIERNDP